MCAIMQEIKEEGRLEIVLEMYRDKEISLQTACKRLCLTEKEFLKEVAKFGIC